MATPGRLLDFLEGGQVDLSRYVNRNRTSIDIDRLNERDRKLRQCILPGDVCSGETSTDIDRRKIRKKCNCTESTISLKVK